MLPEVLYCVEFSTLRFARFLFPRPGTSASSPDASPSSFLSLASRTLAAADDASAPDSDTTTPDGKAPPTI